VKFIRTAWDVVKAHRRAYIVFNLLYYGLTVSAMIVVVFCPSVQASLTEAVEKAFTEGPLSSVGDAYGGGKIVMAMVLTFVVNLLLGSLLSITVPSLVIPFSGLLIGVYRAVLWGLILSPTSPEMRATLIPHGLTLIIEGQAYILVMLGAYIQGRAFLSPQTVGLTGHWRGYAAGVKRSIRLYALVIPMLAVAAIYEALEVILIIPKLVPK